MMENHRMVKKFFYFFVGALSTISIDSFGQTETLGKEETTRLIREAANIMYAGDYDLANEKFAFILDNAQSLPPEICYYFGVNSFQLKRYKQSINWLNKYLELKGSNDEHSESCEAYLKLAEEAYREKYGNQETNQDSVSVVREVTPSNYDINNVVDCNKYGKIVCPVCQGKGVIIKEGLFGKEYNTCPYGDDYGYMSCEDYNLLLQGKLEPKKKD